MKARISGFIALCLFVIGCGKITTVNAPREKQGISLVQNAHYDSDSKVRYMVSNDNTHVYLRFDTDNFSTIMRVRNLGAIVRFDTNGKKKGNQWLKYPVYDQVNVPTVGTKTDPTALPGGMLKGDLFPPSTTAIWGIGELTKSIDLGVNEEGFRCKVILDSMDVLVYEVGIPFKLIGGNKPEDFSSLNMELEIPSPDAGKASTSSSSSSTLPGSTLPSTMPNGMNSGQGGQMNGGGMAGGGMPGGMTGPRNTSDVIPTIRIWMAVNLSPSIAQ